MTYHQRVDARVDKDEHPNGRTHVSHAGPHAHHGTGVVVRLERRAELALGQDDEGIEHLVELAQVEDPAVEGQALVPDASRLSRRRGVGREGQRAIRGRRQGVSVALPALCVLTEEARLSQTGGPVHPAYAVDSARQAIRAKGTDEAPAGGAEHPPPRPCRVDGQEDVVRCHEGKEEPCPAQGPGLLIRGPVVAVQ